jgi:hypothetical protein
MRPAVRFIPVGISIYIFILITTKLFLPMTNDIWTHLTDTLRDYETNVPPNIQGYLINDIDAPLPEAVQLDEVNGIPCILYVMLIDRNATYLSRMPTRSWHTNGSIYRTVTLLPLIPTRKLTILRRLSLPGTRTQYPLGKTLKKFRLLDMVPSDVVLIIKA